MCVTVAVVDDIGTTYCETVQELAATLGVEPSAVSPDPPECCLCRACFAELGAVKQTDPMKWWPEYTIDNKSPPKEVVS